MENVLFKLFSEYIIHGQTFQKSVLTSSRLTDMCEDSGLLPGSRSLLLTQKLGRTFTFTEFCDVLHKLGEAHFPSESPSEAYSLFLEDFMIPLSNQISCKCSIVKQKDLNIPNRIILVCNHLHKSFRSLYTREFAWELKGNLPLDKTCSQSLKKIENLFSMFEIFPSNISKVKLHGLWRDLVIMPDLKLHELISSTLIPAPFKDIGRGLTLSRFILMCYFSSIYSLIEDGTRTEKFMNLLARINVGVSKKPEYKGISFVPTMKIITRMSTFLPKNIMKLKTFRVENDHDKQSYAQYFKGKANLSLFEFLKVLKDMNVMPETNAKPSELQINRSEAELVFQKFKPLNLSQLHKALEHISEKTDISRNISDKNSEEDPFDEKISKIKDPEVQKSLRVLSSVMKPLYLYYADNEQMMKNDQFIQFCREVEIFPDVLSINKLKEIFNRILSHDDHQATQDAGNEKNHDRIDFRIFMQILAFIAFEVSDKTHDVEKLCYLAEFFGQSQAPHKVYKQRGYLQNYQREIFKVREKLRRLFPHVN